MNYYLILFHQIDPLFLRLINLFPERIYAHPCLSLKINNKRLNSLLNNKAVLTKKRYNGNWGGFGVVEATIEGIRQILSEQHDCTHITLLSGADYPIKPIKEYESFLFNNPYKSFVRHWKFYPFSEMMSDVKNPWCHSAEVQKLRLTRYYHNLFNIRYSIPPLENSGYFQFNALQKIKHYVNFRGKGFTNNYSEELVQLLNSYRYKFPRKVPLEKINGGSQWWTLNRKHAEYIIDYYDNNKRITNFFRKIMLPDETFLQTILINSQYSNEVVNDNLRLINFEGDSLHPSIITYDNFEDLKKSNAYFARKFDMTIDGKILDMIDENLL